MLRVEKFFFFFLGSSEIYSTKSMASQSMDLYISKNQSTFYFLNITSSKSKAIGRTLTILLKVVE